MSDRQSENEDHGFSEDADEGAASSQAPTQAHYQPPTRAVHQQPPSQSEQLTQQQFQQQPPTQPPYQQPGEQQHYGQPYQQQPGGQQYYGQQGQQQPPTQPPYQQPGQPQSPYQQQPPTQPPYQQPGQHQPQSPYQQQYYGQPGQHQHYGQPGQADWVQPASGGGFTDTIRRQGGRLGIVAAVVLIGAAGTFALWRAFSDTGGAETPTEAAAMFFSALGEEDVLGVAEIALPSEREAVLEPSAAVLVELARLDLFNDEAIDGDGNPIGLFGYEFDIPAEGEPGALVYQVEPVGNQEDVQWATITGGTIKVTFDPAVAKDGFAGRLREWVDEESANSDLSVETETIDLGEQFQNGFPLEFAVVEEGGRYYVSLFYTIAGFANDKVAPAFDQAPVPVGSDSPEQAVVDLMENLADRDATGVMTMLDPQESRAAYDYWSTFGPDLARSWDEAKATAADEGVTWDLVSAQTTAEDRNGRKVVTFDEVVFSVNSTSSELPLELTTTWNTDGLFVTGTVQGSPAELTVTGQTISGSVTIDGEQVLGELNLETYEGWYEVSGIRTTIHREGDCLVLTSGTESERLCGEEFSPTGNGDLLDVSDDYREIFAGAGRPGLTVVERDGRWYVSGLPTFTYGTVDFLRALEAEDVDRFLDDYQEFLENGFGELN